MDGRTDACQNITFPRTPYAGGNNPYLPQFKVYSYFFVRSFFHTYRLKAEIIKSYTKWRQIIIEMITMFYGNFIIIVII